jgi:DNA-binding response OmpR family regulator
VSRRILLVEDNLDGREFMFELLSTEGHFVDSVGTAREALAYLVKGDAPSYDLLLTDIGLPDGNGWDLVAEVRTRWPTLRIGVITGWEGRSTGAATADFVLRKPVRTKELLDQISLGG